MTTQNKAYFKRPKHRIMVEHFPMTGSGKIQKFELRNQWLAGDFN